MSWNNIKRDPADIAFSKYVRLTHKKCIKCSRRGTGKLEIDGLQASHFHGRGKESTRFDLENVDCLCISCHRYFTEHKTEYEVWKLEQLGQKAYDLLMLRANTTGNKDRKLQAIIWKKLLKEDFGV